MLFAAAAVQSFGALNALLDPKHAQLGSVHSLLSNVDVAERLPRRRFMRPALLLMAPISQLIHPLRALSLQVHQYLCLRPDGRGVAVGERESTKECIARSRFHRQVAGETTCLPAVAGLRPTRRSPHAGGSSRCTGRPA